MPPPFDRTRDFPGKRWINIALRTLHAVGIILLGAALLAGTPTFAGGMLTLASGAAMLALDTWSRPSHLRELSGFCVLCKLLPVAMMPFFPDWSLSLFWFVVVLSMLLSHAPGAVRHLPVPGRR